MRKHSRPIHGASHTLTDSWGVSSSMCALFPVNGNQAIAFGDCSQHFNPITPTSCPYILSVGATAWNGQDGETPTDGDWWKRQFWSGAGFSSYFDTPSYQAGDVKTYLNSIGNLDQGKFNRNGVSTPSNMTYAGWFFTHHANDPFMISVDTLTLPLWVGKLASLLMAKISLSRVQALVLLSLLGTLHCSTTTVSKTARDGLAGYSPSCTPTLRH